MIVALQIVIAVIVEAVLVGMSVAASSRLPDHARLPMQWYLDGTVVKTARRSIALAFTPSLTVFVLVAAVSINFLVEPRAGQGWMMIPVVMFVGFTAIAVHAFHLVMIRKLLDD